MVLHTLHKLAQKWLYKPSKLIFALLMCPILLAAAVTPASAMATPAVAAVIPAVAIVTPAGTAAAFSAVAAAQPKTIGGAVPMLSTRSGAGFGQYDVLLDSYDTEKAAKSAWAGSVLCWNAGLAWNPAIYSSCLALITVCAARAYVTGQRAGMTVTIWNYGWCWKY